MADKNIIMQQKTATGYDKLYPKPSAHGNTHKPNGTDPLPTDAVGTSQITNLAVTTGKIANNAVNADKLANNISLSKFTGNIVNTFNGRTGAVTAIETKFGSKTSSAFTSNSTLTDYPYRASVTDSNVTANDKVYVEFSAAQINEGIYAPITQSYAGGFYIYADSSHTAITVQYTILKGTT